MGANEKNTQSEASSSPDSIGPEQETERSSQVSARDQHTPRWRQIEIMAERAELREMLGDFDLDFEALEQEVFGSEEWAEGIYMDGDAEESPVEDYEFDDEDYANDDIDEVDDSPP